MAETRRRALIGAALREISDHGSLEVTVAQIASRAGVSPALAHHYFGGKDDLILATMGHLLAEFRAVARRRPRPRRRSARAALGHRPRQLRPRAVPPRHDQRLAHLLRLGALLPRRGAAPAHLPAPPAQQPRPRPEAPRPGRPRPSASPRALGALIDGVYLREALRGRPTQPETAIAIVEDYLDGELAR